jgi:hypothetical protein
LASASFLELRQNLNNKEDKQMEKKERCFELRNGEGRTVFGLYIFDRVTGSEGPPMAPETPKPEPKKQEGKKAGNKRAKAPEKTQTTNPPINGDFMTDAQKRYLFRLLSEQGLEGEAAYQHLKDLFQVTSLSEISKLEASRVIDQLVTRVQGGSYERPPF